MEEAPCLYHPVKKKKMFATIFAEISPLFAPDRRHFLGQSFWLGASKFHGQLFCATPVEGDIGQTAITVLKAELLGEGSARSSQIDFFFFF